jgi:hypothetical protein
VAKKGQRHPAKERAKEGGPRRVLNRVAAATQDRALRANRLDPRGPARLKPALAHASRLPKQDSLDPKELPKAKRKREHVIAQKQESAKPVVRPSNLKNNNKQLRLAQEYRDTTRNNQPGSI